MDDAWHLKCGPTWPPPLSIPPAPSTVVPPAPPPPPPWPFPSPSQPPMQVPAASGSANEVNMNSRQPFHPSYAQKSMLEDCSIVQGSFGDMLNLDPCKSGDTELGYSFLALLSGSNQICGEFLQLPNSKYASAKQHVSGGGIVGNGMGSQFVVTSPPLSDHVNGTTANGDELSSFVASRPTLMSKRINTSADHDNTRSRVSYCHTLDSTKLVPHQAFQAVERGTEVSSTRPGWPTVISPTDASKHNIIDTQTAQKVPYQAMSTAFHNASASSRGYPLVFCLNTVGELFVSDRGLIGVTCFCHRSCMSVAKFCEHSGSSSNNPGKAVHLENGMTVAQWRNLCFGIMDPDDGNGWNWPEGLTKGGSVRSAASNAPSLLKNCEMVTPIGTFVGSQRSKETSNKFVFANNPCIAVGQTAVEKSVNKEASDAYLKNNMGRHTFVHNSFSGSTQRGLPSLAKNQTMQPVKAIPFSMGAEESRLTLCKGDNSIAYQFHANDANFFRTCGNLSVPYPSPGTKKASCHNHNISSGSCSTEAFVVDNDGGASSNMELRLGQPSQGNHIFAGPPTAMLQFGALHNSEKPQLNQLLTQGTSYSRVAKRPKTNLQCAPKPSTSKRRQMQHAVGTPDTVDHSKPEETTGDATKNSLISLFLSHLEGNNQSQSVVDIFNNSENYQSRMLDADSLSVECNPLSSSSDVAKKIESKSCRNGPDISKDIGNEKGMRVVDDGETKSNSSVRKKHMLDTRVLASVVNGHLTHSSSFVDDWQSSFYLNQPSEMPKVASDAWTSNKCGKVSLLSDGNNFNVIHKSTKPDPHATVGLTSQNSGAPSRTSATNSCCISKAIPSLQNKYDSDTTQHLMDENLRTLPLGNLVDMSKQEHSTTFFESTPQCTNLCCISLMKMQKNVCQDDKMSSEESRQRPYCNIHDDVSKISLKSGHLCSNCYSNSGAEIAHEPGFTGTNNCCDSTTLMRCVSLCSKEHGLQYPTCRVCGADDQHCPRLGRLSNNKEGFKYELYNRREWSPCLPGKCCCCVHSKCVRGCCILSSHSSSDPSNARQICGEVQMMHVTPSYDKDQMLRDGKRIRPGQCECLRNIAVVENDCCAALWRDVQNEVVARSDSGVTNKPSWVLETSRAACDLVADGPANKLDGTHQERDLKKQQHMSNISSGSSAPAVTEESDEADNVNASSTYTRNGKAVTDFPVDEGSEIERCGSSGEALGSTKCEQVLTFRGELDPVKSRSYCLPSHSSDNLIDEFLLKKSPQSKRIRCEISAKSTGQENVIHSQQCERYSKPDNRSNPMEQDTIDLSNPESGFSAIHSESLDCFGQSKLHLSSSQGIEDSPHFDRGIQKTSTSCKSSIFKRKRSASSSIKLRSLKRSENSHKVWESDKMQSGNDGQSVRALTPSARKKSKIDLAVGLKEDNFASDGRPPKYMLLSCIANTPNYRQNILEKKVRPIVCGNSGIISSGGMSSQRKPAKIVSLSLILKKAKKCGTSECNKKPRQAVFSRLNNAHLTSNGKHYNGLSFWQVRGDAEDPNIVLSKGLDTGTVPIIGKAKGCSGKNDGCAVDSSVTMKEKDSWGDSTVNLDMHHKQLTSQTDMLECSLNKRTRKGRHAKKAICLRTVGKNSYVNSMKAGVQHQVARLFSRKMIKSACSINMTSVNNSQNDQDRAGSLCQISKRRYGKSNNCTSFLSTSDAFCCVCGSSDQEDVNQLLECNKCLIKVHQACYGVSKVPKGHWSCRPCKMNSQNIVCVLCGYEGGAMTRALKSQNIVKSLLKAWKADKGFDCMTTVPQSSTGMNRSLQPSSHVEASECDKSGSTLAERSLSSGMLPAADSKINQLSETTVIQHCDGMPENSQAYNSIIAGVLDLAVTQWVHMVCGLWTPGTRCPNVDTMSAFDVSGASPARKNAVCSMCNRPGGSCIKCRVSNCSFLFHPWCARQKGLLQSEIEGVDNDKVGFYGRCLLHATLNNCHVDSCSVDAELQSPRNCDWTCARTEGFKGRKREGGWDVKYQKPGDDGGGCVVSQEQINAWLHINGQKSCPRRVVKPPCSDIEYDFRKEYIRYKQSKGWRHLVVYKSGIHALGLYTSQFIARGAMVVEYVGEIVGLRVADKREIEYQSGRRLQYKSACYFFRIDKEHIIDATRKGGIARFVNHSCLPNCVAKVISVRNEKKVVFFAERDIYPGEEITYDYHFNHEDDCEKIPCFCNSKNCRRYLN